MTSTAARDPRIFADLVRAYDGRLRRLVYRLLGDADVVDDVMQETYLRAYRARAKFRGDADMATWLYRIAHNCCVDEIRSARRRPVPVDRVADRPAPGADLASQVTNRDAVRTALLAIPVEQRVALLLIDGDEFDYTGAAAVLGVPRGTVASRVARARRAFRAALASGQEPTP